MGLDGTLTLLAPSRRRQWRWWLPASGDPACLAKRLSVLAAADPMAATEAAAAPSLGARVLACLQSLPALDPFDPGQDPQPVAAASLRSELILRRWHRGPLWIAIWRCHGDLGWQRRCGPMLLTDFLEHQQLQRTPGRPESRLLLRQRPIDAPGD